jgi:isopentenyl phosphate kinase
MENLQFLKLGGSLITDKSISHSPRLPVLARLAEEIASVMRSRPDLRLLVGHGSGSFGHVPAKRYGTRQGVHSPDEWLGFVEVWREASALSRLVVDALSAAGLPVVALPPSASLVASDGKVAAWELTPIISALQHGLVPVVNGDVIFDRQRGGTILSTEDLFLYLAPYLIPQRLLLAGMERGVWADFPERTRLISLITPRSIPKFSSSLGGSAAVDVTGGMQSKVQSMLRLVDSLPDLQVQIFCGDQPGNLEKALSGKEIGTLIRNE